MNFSVVILTYNEEKNIQACLDTLRFCDDIVVVDSYSDDRTCEIARSFGCRVVEHKLEDLASLRNWAMENVELKHDWVFHIDADERFTSELAGECEEVVHEDLFSGCMVAEKLMFMGKWLKWSSGYPVYQMRFAKRGEISFVQQGVTQRESGAERGTGFLKYCYLHFPFKKGIDEWSRKHQRYAEKEALHHLSGSEEVEESEMFSGVNDPVSKRRPRMSFSHRLPFRPCLRFLYMYLIRMGFLDGRPGFRYCQLMTGFERMVDKQIRKIGQSTKNQG